jgi:hypothetical protein
MDEWMRRVRRGWTSGEHSDGIDVSKCLTASYTALENKPPWKMGTTRETSFQKFPGTRSQE